MKPKNFPGRKNIRRANAVEVEIDNLRYDFPERKERREEVIRNTESKIIDQGRAANLRSKKHR